ncbi:MAG: hypothetical protein WA172_00025 [Terriglobales bacterium]
MSRTFTLQSVSSARLRHRGKQRGYVMITMLLAVALMTLGLLSALPAIKQQIQRDREEELQRRGTAYMRAIQRFYRAFGRYPSRIEDLEHTNNFRFLRKRYTDPMSIDRATGKEKDFKLLHQSDISLNSGPVLGPTTEQFSSSGGFGSSFAGNLSKGEANSNSPGSSFSDSNSGSGFNGPMFGGGPLLGVASTSKEKSLREFYGKNHYNDWIFIYVPESDLGGLLMGPVNPGISTTAPGNLGAMAPGLPASGGTAQGQGTIPTTGQTPTPQTQAAPTSGSTSPN